MKVIDPDIVVEKPSGPPQRLSVVTSRHKLLSNNAGFTLVELIVVAAIIGVLVAVAMPAFSHFINRVKVTRAIAEIRVFEKEILSMVVDQNTLPVNLSELGLDSIKDPWGNDYQYLKIGPGVLPRRDNIGIDLNTDFDVFSFGKDGLSQQMVTGPNSLDDIIRARDGSWIGEGEDF